MTFGIPQTSFDGQQAPSLGNATWSDASVFVSGSKALSAMSPHRKAAILAGLFPKAPKAKTKREIRRERKAFIGMSEIYENAAKQGAFE